MSYRGLLRAIPSKPNTDRRCNIAIGTNISCPWLSSRPISRRQLCTLLCLHPAPIYPVLSRGTCGFRLGYLILRGASRLDAFSAYPCRAWLPCHGTDSQQVHQRPVRPGPLVLRTAPLKYPAPAPDLSLIHIWPVFVFVYSNVFFSFSLHFSVYSVTAS